MKGLVHIKFAKRANLLAKRGGWTRPWVELVNGELNIFYEVKDTANLDTTKPNVSLKVLSLHNFEIDKGILTVQTNKDIMFLVRQVR